MSRRPARCTQADLDRAVRAADHAAVKRVVEVTPDGTIRLVPADHNEKTQEPEKIEDGEDIVL